MSASELWCADKSHTVEVQKLVIQAMENRRVMMDSPVTASELWCGGRRPSDIYTDESEDVEQEFGSLTDLRVSPRTRKLGGSKKSVDTAALPKISEKERRIQLEIEARIQQESRAIVERERLIQLLEVEVHKQKLAEANEEIEASKRKVEEANALAERYKQYAQKVKSELEVYHRQQAEESAWAANDYFFSGYD